MQTYTYTEARHIQTVMGTQAAAKYLRERGCPFPTALLWLCYQGVIPSRLCGFVGVFHA